MRRQFQARALRRLGKHFGVLDFSITLLYAKAIAFLAEMPAEDRPDAIGFLECHLRGAALSRMRRVVQKIGWRMFSTPALLKEQQTALAGEGPKPQASELDEASLKKHQNTGGEAILMDPARKASGYHQGVEAFGYRSTLVRMKGWTLHLIVAYFDSGWALKLAPMPSSGKPFAPSSNHIKSMNALWLTCADCNHTPGEVAHSLFVNFLQGVVVAPCVDFDCASAPPPGRVIDMVISSRGCAPHLQVLPYYTHSFKPHVVGLDVRLSLDIDADMANAQVAPEEIGN